MARACCIHALRTRHWHPHRQHRGCQSSSPLRRVSRLSHRKTGQLWRRRGSCIFCLRSPQVEVGLGLLGEKAKTSHQALSNSCRGRFRAPPFTSSTGVVRRSLTHLSITMASSRLVLVCSLPDDSWNAPLHTPLTEHYADGLTCNGSILCCGRVYEHGDVVFRGNYRMEFGTRLNRSECGAAR